MSLQDCPGGVALVYVNSLYRLMVGVKYDFFLCLIKFTSDLVIEKFIESIISKLFNKFLECAAYLTLLMCQALLQTTDN